MNHAERQVQFLLQGGELDMARSRTSDGAHDHATLFALIDELLEGLNRRVFLYAKLPAHDAPSVDRDEVTRLVSRPPDHLVDGAAWRRLRHHQVAIWTRCMQLRARNAAARPQHIVKAGLDPILFEIRLDDTRGRVDRAAGRLIDDPVDLAGGKPLLRPARRAQRARRRRHADRGAAQVAQETASIDPRLSVHLVLPRLSSARPRQPQA